MHGHVGCPLVLDPKALQRLPCEDPGQEPALPQDLAESKGPIGAGLQILLVQEGPQALRLEFLLEGTDPFRVRGSVRQEEIVPVRWLAQAGHRTSPAAASLSHAVPVPSRAKAARSEEAPLDPLSLGPSIPGPDPPGKRFLDGRMAFFIASERRQVRSAPCP